MYRDAIRHHTGVDKMTINDVVKQLTWAHAHAWSVDTEKWLWVDYNVLCNNNLPCTEHNVNIVELRLEAIIAEGVDKMELLLEHTF